MLKVLLMTTKMDAGGAERYLYEHIRHMNRNDMEIDYYLLYKVESMEMKSKYENLGVRIFERGLEEKGGRGSIDYLRDMKCFFREYGSYDVIHVNGTAPILQMCAMFMAKKVGVRNRIVHSHSAPKRKSGCAEMINSMARFGTCCFATRLLACSEEAGRYKFGNRGVQSIKYKVMKNGIDTKKFVFSPIKREKVRSKHQWEKTFVIMNVGRLSQEKNQIFLLKIVLELIKKKIDTRLVLIGEGPDFFKLQKFVEENEMENFVQFLGNRNNVDELLQGADVFCLPSLFEGFPIAGLEAESVGVYCVVSEAVPESWNFTGKVKFISSNDSVEIWADAILDARKYTIEDKSNVVRDAGYDIRDTAKKLEKIYRKG